MAIFRKKETSKIRDTKILNLINEGCKVEGDINSDSVIRIDGTIEGSLNIDEGAIIGEKGLVKGNIATKSLIIYGIVNGNTDSDSLEIKSSGCVNGEIRTSRLHIEFGGVYNGALTIVKEGLLLNS